MVEYVCDSCGDTKVLRDSTAYDAPHSFLVREHAHRGDCVGSCRYERADIKRT